MKKIILLVLIIIAVAAAGLFAYFYFYPKKAQNILIPEVDQVEKIKIRIEGDTARLGLSLRLENKGPFKMNIDSIIYHIRFDTATLLSRSQDVRVVLRPGSADTFLIPVNLPFKRLMANIKKVQDRDSVPILSDIRIVYSTIFGTRSLPHQKTNTIAVPRPPKFELEKIEYAGRDKSTLFLKAHIIMHNYGQIQLNVFNLKYRIKAEDLFTAEGSYKKKISVEPKSDITAVLPIEVDVKKIYKTIFKIITNRDNIEYDARITGQIEAKKLGEERTDVEINKSGKFELKK